MSYLVVLLLQHNPLNLESLQKEKKEKYEDVFFLDRLHSALTFSSKSSGTKALITSWFHFFSLNQNVVPFFFF